MRTAATRQIEALSPAHEQHIAASRFGEKRDDCRSAPTETERFEQSV
jgi:hypothetical protein